MISGSTARSAMVAAMACLARPLDSCQRPSAPNSATAAAVSSQAHTGARKRAPLTRAPLSCGHAREVHLDRAVARHRGVAVLGPVFPDERREPRAARAHGAESPRGIVHPAADLPRAGVLAGLAQAPRPATLKK